MDKSELWHLKKKKSGKEYPNIPFDALKTWIFEARVETYDYLRTSSMKKWVKASSIKELAPFFAPASLGSDVISSQDVGFSFLGDNDEEELSIELTPMIDVTFLLLIFFMVTATFAIHEVKNIQVPKASHTEKAKKEKLSIAIGTDRKILLRKKEIRLEDLKAGVQAAVSETQQQDIIVAADKDLDYGFIMSVLDEINGAGVKNVKLQVQKK